MVYIALALLAGSILALVAVLAELCRLGAEEERRSRDE